MAFDKLNPIIKVKFLELLRSGEYTQIAGRMRNGEKCLCAEGVLAEAAVQCGFGRWSDDMYIIEHGNGRSQGFNLSLDRDGYRYLFENWGEVSHSSCPIFDEAWLLGVLPDQESKIVSERGHKQYGLTDLNDELELDFNQIALVVEMAW